MFVTSGQIYIFFSCLAFGIASGIIYSVIIFIKKVIKIKAFRIIFDLLFFIALAVAFLIYTFLLKFPSVRAYMLVGVISGLYIYLKSFHFILAKMSKRLYNIMVNKKRKKRKAEHERANAEN